MSIVNQTLKQLVLPIKKQPTNQTQSSIVLPDAYRSVSKFGENGHGIYNNPNVQQKIIPTGNVTG